MTSITDDLSTVSGVQVYLQNNPQFAAHTVEKLSGGFGNFTYRIYLDRPFDGRQTLVLKYAPPYAAATKLKGELPLDQKRQVIEVQALRLLGRLLNSTSSNVPKFLAVPTVHAFDEEGHVIIMDDIGKGCRTLKELLIEESLPKTVAQQIGTALGEFIAVVHTCHQNPDIDLTNFANYQFGKELTVFMYYGRVVSILTGKHDIPTLADPLLDIPETKLATISKLVEKRKEAIHAASASDPLTHGDFWPGNLVLTLKRGTNGTVEGVEKLYVVDWELCKTGLPALDLGQFCAEIYLVSEFFPAREETTRSIIESFLGSYKERRGVGKDIELGRAALSHIGTHAVTITPCCSPWSGPRQKTREVVENGVEMMVLGEEGGDLAVRTNRIIGPLFDL